MALLPKSRLWRTIIIVLGGFVLLVAFFYAEEDLRGWLAWEHCKHELAAKGEEMDWNKLIPPPVPDDQNFFKAPDMTEWFVRWTNAPPPDYTNRLAGLANNKLNGTTITNEADARNYLKWSDQFQPQFDEIREALKRPYARIDCDYSRPQNIQIPNFISIRSLAQVLACRAESHLLLGQPDKALDELTFLDDSRHIMEGTPTGKPMTLVAAMINVAVSGLYVGAIADGLQSHSWQEPQLAALQKQLAEINLTPFVKEGMQDSEQAGFAHRLQTASTAEFVKEVYSDFSGGRSKSKSSWQQSEEKTKLWLVPRGWRYQNAVTVVMLIENGKDCLDLTNNLVLPHKLEVADNAIDKSLKHIGAYNFFAAIAIPNFIRAYQTTAHNQTLVNEAQIVCALERYHLAHGEYPATLDALAPQFIEKLPHDIIGGDPLNYRATFDGKFLLYSIGWNEKDDGGKDGGTDFTKADWVWKN